MVFNLCLLLVSGFAVCQCFPSAGIPINAVRDPTAGNKSSLDKPSGTTDLAKSGLLLQYLMGDIPGLVYVDEDPDDDDEEEEDKEEPANVLMVKRWYNLYRSPVDAHKRQGKSRGYVCNPSRHDVYNLLLALHDSQMGNTDRVVTFCNRRRPARTIFTNMRFLGKRK